MSQNTDEDVCPVCGQEYVHKRDISEESEMNLREDYTQCRHKVNAHLTGLQQGTVYVHEPTGNVDVTRETVVKHVDRDPFVSGDRKLGNRELIQPNLDSQESVSSGSGTGGTSGDVSGSQPGDFS